MKRNPLIMRSILAVLVAAALGLGWYFFVRAPRPDFDQLGGTILVYEFIPIEHRELNAELAADTAKALQRRLDPEDRAL